MWDKATPLPGIPGRGLLRLVEGRRGAWGTGGGKSPWRGSVSREIAGYGEVRWRRKPGREGQQDPRRGRGPAGGSVVAFEMDAGFFAGFLQEFRHVHGQPGAGGVLLF